ncbi:MAG: acyl-ACP--UDP-N-acetylglucosamine O-acyltransferase [Phycisphaeraceae bacterium]|nr:acyl-ACP--UDP-N-acetylglucosamine O-acyltransferase [Phycisphaeraceae bacterium]
MPQVHPTAIVDSSAELADDVVIGPWCWVGPGVKIGGGCRLIARVHIHQNVEIGEKNLLYPGVILGFEPQSRKWTAAMAAAGVKIGDRNILREGVTIHHATDASQPTRIGDDNMLMSNVHLGHDVIVGNDCTLATGAAVGGHVVLFDQVNVGGNASIHQYCRVGRMAMLGGVSGLASDLPPFCMASGMNNLIGLNLIGIRRSTMSEDARAAIKWAFQVIALDGHTSPVMIDRLRKRAGESTGDTRSILDEMAQFVQDTKRGLIPHSIISQKQKIQR